MISVIQTGFGEGKKQNTTCQLFLFWNSTSGIPRSYWRESELFAQQISDADGSLENTWVDSELHTQEYFTEFACMDFTVWVALYGYSCLLLMEFSLSLYIFSPKSGILTEILNEMYSEILNEWLDYI